MKSLFVKYKLVYSWHAFNDARGRKLSSEACWFPHIQQVFFIVLEFLNACFLIRYWAFYLLVNSSVVFLF